MEFSLKFSVSNGIYLSMGNCAFLIKDCPDDTFKTAGSGQRAVVPEVLGGVLGEEVLNGLGINSGLDLSSCM